QHGHAIELRLYAEDPAAGFLPGSGTLERLRLPAPSAHVRLDGGVVEDDTVTIFYDPMIAKLITHAATREEAIDRMVRAIDDYQVSGVKTTLGFCRWAIQQPAFASGNFDTHFVKKYFTPEVLATADTEAQEMAAIAAAYAWMQSKPAVAASASNSGASVSRWKMNRR
ncbi:MAG: biotin carboxylase, partial [Flavobacteriales bacterium]